jgi:hypothetical protein
MGLDHQQERDAHCHGGGESPSPRGPSFFGRGADLASDYRSSLTPLPPGETRRYPNSYSIHLHHICCTHKSGESGRQPVARDRTLDGPGAILPRPAQRGEAGARSAPGEGRQGFEQGVVATWRWPSPADLRSAASPAARARRYGRCRGQKTGVLVSKRESRSRVRTKIWVRMSRERGRG